MNAEKAILRNALRQVMRSARHLHQVREDAKGGRDITRFVRYMSVAVDGLCNAVDDYDLVAAATGLDLLCPEETEDDNAGSL